MNRRLKGGREDSGESCFSKSSTAGVGRFVFLVILSRVDMLTFEKSVRKLEGGCVCKAILKQASGALGGEIAVMGDRGSLLPGVFLVAL